MIHYRLASLGAEHVRNEEDFVHRVLEMPIAESDYWKLRGHIQYVGVTDRFKDVMKTFPTEVGTPAGFRRELQMASDGVLRVDLVRDIAYDKTVRDVPRTSCLVQIVPTLMKLLRLARF